MDNTAQETTVESAVESALPAVGDIVTGTVDKVVGALVIVNLGDAGTARIDQQNLFLDGGQMPQAGDAIEAKVVSVNNGVELSRKYVEAERLLATLRDHMSNGTPVQGTVVGIQKSKKGYEVRLSEMRAVCAVAEFDPRHERCSRRFVNQSFEFLISDISEGQNGRTRISVSRKALLEEESRRLGVMMEERFKVGDVVKGHVSNVAKFGVFVDFGDKIEGLIPFAELSHQRVEDPASVYKKRQEVEVKVISIDGARNRLSLSVRQLTPDPWVTFTDANPAGTALKGKVTRLMDFGAFVELAEHVEGLIHIGSIALARVNHPSEHLSEGQEVDVVIEEIVRGDRRRIRLMTPEVAETRKPLDFEVKEGVVITVPVIEANAKGVVVMIGGSFSGFIPAGETDTARSANLTEVFPAGREVEAKIMSVDSRRGRVRLSIKALRTHADEVAFKSYKSEERAAGKGFNSSPFADLENLFK